MNAAHAWVTRQVDEEGFHLVEQKTAAKPFFGPGARGGRGRGRCVCARACVRDTCTCTKGEPVVGKPT